MAVNGSRNSMVGAYLLKKQGHDVEGVAVRLRRDGGGGGDGAPPLPKELVRRDAADTARIGRLCDALGVPLHVVHAAERHAAEVAAPLVAAAVSCRAFARDVAETTLVVDLLLEKARSLGADLIATGHYAKALRSRRHGGVVLLASDDPGRDQSHLLCRLGQRRLEGLVLPLAKMRRADVEKVARLLGGDFPPEDGPPPPPPASDPRLHGHVAGFAPGDLVREGNVIDCATGDVVGEHTGLGLHPGQVGPVLKNGQRLDGRYAVVNYCVLKEDAFVCPKDGLFHTHVLLESLETPPGLDVSASLEGSVRVGNRGGRLPCRLTFKNNGAGVLELAAPAPGLVFPGECLAFYVPQGGGDALLASGLCSYSYHEAGGRALRYPAGTGGADGGGGGAAGPEGF